MTDKPQIVDAQPVSLAKQEPQRQTLATMTPNEMLTAVITQGADPEKLQKVTDWIERVQKEQARKDFVAAMTVFTSLVPAIIKTRAVDFTTSKGRTYYKFAGLAETFAQIQPLMGQCQFTLTFTTLAAGKAGYVRLKGILSHVSGHCETMEMEGGPDESGNKNPLQAVASTVTYLRRTIAFCLLGLVAADEIDDDGQGAGEPQQGKKPAADPGEAQARKDFWNACNQKAGMDFTQEQIKAIFAKVQQASGRVSAADCLAWVQADRVLLAKDRTLSMQKDGQAGATEDVGATDPTEGEPALDQASAAANASTTARAFPADTGSPPPVSEMKYECDECLAKYPVKPAKCLTKGCHGVAQKIKE